MSERVNEESVLVMSSSAEQEAKKRPASSSSGGGGDSPLHNKRPRTDEASSHTTAVSFDWVDDPIRVNGDGVSFYDAIRIALPSSSSKSGDEGAAGAAGAAENRVTIRTGDAVCLLSDESDKTIFLRVDGFFADRKKEEQIFGRLFLNQTDLKEQLAASEEMVQRILPNEFILTNVREESGISSIDKLQKIRYIKAGEAMSSALPMDTVLCRYKLRVDPKNKTMEWACYESDNDNEVIPEAIIPESNDTVDDTLSSGDSASDDESASSVELSKVMIQEGEGTTLRGDIQVGSRYQMKVGPYIPGQTVRSRGPKLIYKANGISDEKMLDFLNQVADIHNAYLRRHGMCMEEPYSPLPAERVEEIVKAMPGNKPLTGSFMSTASMLASSTKSRLQKECDADVLLEILHDHDYDVDAAVKAIEHDLNRITGGWTRAEKDIFDDGFRRHQGALRMISRAVAPTKNMKQVVDYHYRFKIPDQFRKYQDKKREQAVRMVECIQTRKYHESLSSSQTNASSAAANNGNNGVGGNKPAHWSEKSVVAVAESKDDRIQEAKQLLLDVKDKFGRDVMANVASVVRQLQISYEEESRDELFSLLRDQPELQKRFLVFLPKHF